jgi:hypothetical protein
MDKMGDVLKKTDEEEKRFERKIVNDALEKEK